MRFGPTSLQLTTILAKGLNRPKFRTSLRISEQVITGETSYMIKVPESDNYYRFTPYEFEFITLFDGTLTPAEVAEEMINRYPRTPLSEEKVLEYLDQADPNLFERSQSERNLAVLEKIRQERKGRAEHSDILYFIVHTWETERFVSRVYPYLRWCFTPGFVIFCLILFALMGGLIATDYARIQQDTVNFYRHMYDSLYNFWIFWVLMFFVIGLHELGHGLTCKHFGGEVPQMGIMFIYFNPAFFTNCADMYLFDKNSKRLWTIIAGLWVEMIVCSFATLGWYFSQPGSLLNTISYQLLLFTGISALFFNLNPFIRFDGYYVLSQLLEIESLSENSYEYLWAWIRLYILRHPIELPAATRRKRRIFMMYSIAALIYRVFVISLVILLANGIFSRRFGATAGTLATFGLLYVIMRRKVRKMLPFILGELRRAREKMMKWKISRGQMVGAAAVALIVIVPFTPNQVHSEFQLEPGERSYIRATVPGHISQVNVHEGDSVQVGAALAVLHNPDLEARATILAHNLEEAQHSLVAAQASEDSVLITKFQQEARRLDTDLADARRKVAGLTLRSPLTGVVTTPQIEQKVGAYLGEGAEFAVIVNRHQMKARVLVEDLDLSDVHVGDLVRLKVWANPFPTYAGHVEQIMPAAALEQPVAQPQKMERYGQELTNYFAVVLSIPNSTGELREGMTGNAKILGRRSPLIYRAGRDLWRWLRSQIW